MDNESNTNHEEELKRLQLENEQLKKDLKHKENLEKIENAIIDNSEVRIHNKIGAILNIIGAIFISFFIIAFNFYYTNNLL